MQPKSVAHSTSAQPFKCWDGRYLQAHSSSPSLLKHLDIFNEFQKKLGEMAQKIKHLVCKHKDPSLNLRTM